MATNDTTSLTGFHVSRDARGAYQLGENFFAYRGKAQIPNFQTARTFASRLNEKRDIARDPSQMVQASAVNAVAIIQGIQQYLFQRYCAQHPGVLSQALTSVQDKLGDQAPKTLNTFVSYFPPLPVYKDTMHPYDYILAMYDGRPNREATLEELLMLWISNANPAFKPFMELFGDESLRSQTAYPQMTAQLNQFFAGVAQTDPGNAEFPGGENILDLLLEPVRSSPDSLEGQLNFLLDRWSGVIDQTILMRVLTVRDALREDYRFLFGGGGPIDTVSGASVEIPDFGGPAGPEFEAEAFTLDRDWMPNLVLMAKNAYVWLDQLSKKYKQELIRLDQIPDAELEQLARWGFTGLWLIGLWERSEASKRIKHMTGNPDAVASAYSLWDYQIAARLGGEEALQNLRARAWKFGIRLASDMVPNHVGIDGRWVIEHPEYFIALDYSPYPNYTFNGPDLSSDPRVGIYLEDHYYDRSDAAVVFKRVDRWTGSVKYLYHGNDGTTMPWNDTAQLDYLNPQVREAMIHLIIDIAKRFPIIRFDAAMTLVKRHVQRLWWPEPGSGSGIASRAEFGMTKAQFDQAMPEEFWREVVDRAAVEAPDTLLLAEAFWMMETYFVRTLGMHRVYNSAFMNILRDEENAKYRALMKNMLEFDPEVVRRFVNFQNNPDEKTAVEQFGKGDKYFGICMVMLTMPGLPMFGHGQIEGFTEKYGMEYYRAYYDETPDQWLIERHERELFPLIRKRSLFAGVENFALYDFETAGGIDENVYAYSNRKGDERTLVAYNNRFNHTAGWVRRSVPYSIKVEGRDERVLTTQSLTERLVIPADEDTFITFRDARSGLEYIRHARELAEQGIYIELGAYQYMVLLDFRILKETAGSRYRELANSLMGRGVPSIFEALQALIVEPVLMPFNALVNGPMLQRLYVHRDQPEEGLMEMIQTKVAELIEAIHEFSGAPVDERDAETAELAEEIPTPASAAKEDAPEAESDAAPEPTLAEKVVGRLEKVLMLPVQETPKLFAGLVASMATDRATQGALIAWALLGAFGDDPAQTRALIDEWLLGKAIAKAIQDSGVEEYEAGRALTAVKLATARRTLLDGNVSEEPNELLYALLADTDARQLMGVNQFNGVTYYDKQGFESLLRWLLLTAQVDGTGDALAVRYKTVEALMKADKQAEYQVNKLREGLKKAASLKPEKP